MWTWTEGRTTPIPTPTTLCFLAISLARRVRPSITKTTLDMGPKSKVATTLKPERTCARRAAKSTASDASSPPPASPPPSPPPAKKAKTEPKGTRKTKSAAKAAATAATTDDAADDEAAAAPSTQGVMLDKGLVLRIIIAKLEASKTCDWFELSRNLAAEAPADTPGKAKGKAGGKKKDKEGKPGLSGSELHDLYHM